MTEQNTTALLFKIEKKNFMNKIEIDDFKKSIKLPSNMKKKRKKKTKGVKFDLTSKSVIPKKYKQQQLKFKQDRIQPPGKSSNQELVGPYKYVHHTILGKGTFGKVFLV